MYTYTESGSVTTLSTVNTTLTAINLPLGSYYLVETTAPSGKMANGKKIPFTIAPDSTQTLNLTISVKDNNIIMPNTGSRGRLALYGSGLISLFAALAVFTYYRKNGEFTKDDLAVDRDMEIDCDIGQEILVYFECWFDADRKFSIDTSENDAWLNMYGRFNPYEDTLTIECEIDRDDGSSYFDYFPTDAETQLMKDLITEKIQEVYHQSPMEFCESAFDDSIEIGGI